MNQNKSAPPVQQRQTLNLWPDTGRLLGLGRNATYAAAERGDIPVLRIGGRLLVPKAALERLLAGANQAA
jgi:excisionase family DNA binding protein